jgi:hypothetical protein
MTKNSVAVTYEYEPPEPHLGWSYHIKLRNGWTSASYGYATREDAEADALEAMQLCDCAADEEEEE